MNINLSARFVLSYMHEWICAISVSRMGPKKRTHVGQDLVSSSSCPKRKRRPTRGALKGKDHTDSAPDIQLQDMCHQQALVQANDKGEATLHLTPVLEQEPLSLESNN